MLKCSLRRLAGCYCVMMVVAVLGLWLWAHPSQRCAVPEGMPKPILMWTKFFGGEINLESWKPRNCSVSCFFTYDLNNYCRAPLILFHAREFEDYPKLYTIPSKSPGQLFGVYGWESPNHQHYTSDQAFVSNFDFTITYSRHSNFMITYGPSTSVFTKEFCTPPSERKRRAVWFVSNCKFVNNNRMEFAQELSQHFPIDFYGSCFDAYPPDLPRDRYDTDAMRRFVGTYKFFLSFENTNCYDYITEKYFRTLESCAIPVVLGPPNGEDFEPMGETTVLVDDRSAAEVAAEMRRIDEDDSVFAHYLRWKEAPREELNPFFLEVYERATNGEAFCDLCKLAHQPRLPHPVEPVRC
eukprot:TRINITY_DN653_c0_g1_i1.p1 TRINITY_DN653_c0_g1~~TRINITY_DN653_c0_g1_i1.p1  ORF type:complete len:353 (-),score=36.77 TRINITY_DN653_c0_g1_i1:505-1563(-)